MPVSAGYTEAAAEGHPPVYGSWLPAGTTQPIVDRHILMALYTPQIEEAKDFFRQLRWILEQKHVANQEVVLIEHSTVWLVEPSPLTNRGEAECRKRLSFFVLRVSPGDSYNACHTDSRMKERLRRPPRQVPRVHGCQPRHALSPPPRRPRFHRLDRHQLPRCRGSPERPSGGSRPQRPFERRRPAATRPSVIGRAGWP